MSPTLRNIAAVIAGLLVGAVVNGGLISLSPFIIAPPAGVDVTDTESLRASIHLFHPRHFVMPFLAHALGTLIGALVAFRVAASHHTRWAWLIGATFLVGGILAATMIPAPTWFIALDLIAAYLPMAWLAILLGRAARGESAPVSPA